MSNDLGMLNFECDAPPYPIVRACRKLGLRAPEDVRWSRKCHHKRSASWIHYLTAWSHLLAREPEAEPACNCGQPLPILESYSFTFQSGEQIDYEIGQCAHCRAIYWEKI